MNYVEDDILEYIPRTMVFFHHARMNGELRPILLQDKALGAARLHDHAVACVREYLSLDPASGFADADGRPCEIGDASRIIEAAGGSAFAKPVDGFQGEGARIVSADPADLAKLQQGGQRMIFQPVVQQHPMLASLNPSSINTLRLETLNIDGHILSHVAALRVGRQGQVVDNAAAGGLVVKVDMITGRVDRYARMKPKFSTERFEHHPDTGAAFGAITIPFWAEACDLVHRGARAMAPMRSIGWDVAITADGPIVIEANGAWDPAVFQLCQPLGTTGLADYILQRRTTAPAAGQPPGSSSELSP